MISFITPISDLYAYSTISALPLNFAGSHMLNCFRCCFCNVALNIKWFTAMNYGYLLWNRCRCLCMNGVRGFSKCWQPEDLLTNVHLCCLRLFLWTPSDLWDCNETQMRPHLNVILIFVFMFPFVFNLIFSKNTG